MTDGQVTIAWDDFGTGATASPAFDDLMSNLVQAGDAYGFTGATGASRRCTSLATSVRATGRPRSSTLPEPPLAAADPVAIATGVNGTDVNGDGKNDVVVADEGTNQVGVLLNSATAGTLTGPTVYSAGTAPPAWSWIITPVTYRPRHCRPCSTRPCPMTAPPAVARPSSPTMAQVF